MKIDVRNVRVLLAAGLTLEDLSFEENEVLPPFKYKNSNPDQIRLNYRIIQVTKGHNDRTQIVTERPDKKTRRFNVSELEFI